MVDPVQYIFLNEALRMSVGKASAQAAHAAIRGYKLTPDDSNLKRLFHRSNHEKTVILQARNVNNMWAIKEYIRAAGIRSAMVIDEGRTEIQPMTPTAIGVEILDKNHALTTSVFSEFKLYGNGTADAWANPYPFITVRCAELIARDPKPPTLLERLKGRIS